MTHQKLDTKLLRPQRFLILALALVVNSARSNGLCQGPLLNFSELSRQSHLLIENNRSLNIDESIANTPAMLQSGLPKGARFLEEPLSKAPSHRYYRPLGVGRGYVGLNVPVQMNGEELRTNIGVSPIALAESTIRVAQGKEAKLVSSSARAVVLWLHGGGTNQSSWQNGSSAAAALASRQIEVISMDFFGHGSGPRAFYKDPESYIKFVLEFMNQHLASSDVPIILAGHSMGGMIADITSRLYPKSRLRKEYPGLRFEGIGMLSPPADPTPGEAFHTRFQHDNTTREVDETEDTLMEVNNINLPSQRYLLALDFIHRWDTSLVNNSDDILPLFFAMGTGDELWVGKEELFENFVKSRKNLKNEHYKLYSEGVDYNNKPVVPGHIIPGVYSPARPDLMKQGKAGMSDPKVKHPEVFVDLMDFIEDEIIGRSASYTPEENNTTSTLARLFELWGSSSFFRTFASHYAKSSRKTHHPEVVQLLIKRVDKLRGFGSLYFSKLTEAAPTPEDKKARADTEEYRLMKNALSSWSGSQIPAPEGLQEWYSQLPEDARSSFVFDYFSDLQEKDPNSAGKTINRNERFQIVETPESLPGNLSQILKSLEALSGPSLLVELKNEAFRVMDIINGDYSSQIRQDDKRMQTREALREKTDKVEAQRNTYLLEVSSLNARKKQLERVFAEFSLPDIWRIDNNLREDPHYMELARSGLERLQALHEKVESHESVEAIESLFNETSDILAEISVEFQTIAYSSFMGFQARAYLSDALDRLKKTQSALEKEEDDNAKRNPYALRKQVKIIIENSMAFCQEAQKIIQMLQEPSKIDASEIEAADEAIQQERDLVNHAKNNFFDFRAELISQWIEEGTFGTEGQPDYPPEYGQLIQVYESTQDAFQRSKSQREQTLLRAAQEGKLGVLARFIATELSSLEPRIQEIENSILADIETELQQALYEISLINAGLDNDYSSGLFHYQDVRSIEHLSQETPWPVELGPLQDLLSGWRHTWRDIPAESENTNAY